MSNEKLIFTADEAVRALRRLENPDEAIYDAIWRNFPSPSDIDDGSDERIHRMIMAALLTALGQ